MKTMTITVLTGWRAVLAWLAIATIIIAYWELGKALTKTLILIRHTSLIKTRV